MTITELFKDKKVKVIFKSLTSNTYNSIEYFDETFLLAIQKYPVRRFNILSDPSDLSSRQQIRVEYKDIKSLIRFSDIVCIEEIVPRLTARDLTSPDSPSSASSNL